ncbi:MAG: MATE family efflux transporter, partial [Aristaeellaceae bacterium]
LCIVSGIGFSMGLTPVVGAFCGQGRPARAGLALRMALVADGLVALLLMGVMGIVYLQLDRLGQPDELLPLIRPYYLIVWASLLPVMLFNGFKQFTDGLTFASYGMWMMLGGNVLNIVGNWLLINGVGPFPEWGLAGAGVSTLFSRVVMVIACVFLVGYGSRFRIHRVGLFRAPWEGALLRRLMQLGAPMALQSGMETAAFSLSAVMVGWLGTMALAAHQVMISISTIPFMIYCGVGSAVAVRVSYCHGQGDLAGVRCTARAGLILMVCLEVVLASLLFLLRHMVGGWFTESTEVASMVALLFIPFTLYQFGDGLQINYANALRGIADVRPLVAIAFVAYFLVSLPAGYFMGFLCGWGLVGIWMAFPLGLTMAGVLMGWRFRASLRGRRRGPRQDGV